MKSEFAPADHELQTFPKGMQYLLLANYYRTAERQTKNELLLHLIV